MYDNISDVINNNSIVGDAYLEEDRTNNYIKGYWHHKLGNCYSFCADKKGNPLINYWFKMVYIYLFIISNTFLNMVFFNIL